MKKLTALVLAAVMALSLCTTAFTTAFAAYDGGIDHYSYSWNYLKNYLLAEGDVIDSTYYVSEISYTDAYNYFPVLDYNKSRDAMYFTFGVYDKGSKSPWFYLTMDIPSSKKTALDVSASITLYSESSGQDETIYTDFSVYPGSYTESTKYSLKYLDRKGYFNDSVIDDIVSLSVKYATEGWNYLLAAYPGMTLGNFGFTALYDEETSIYPRYYTVSFNTSGMGSAPASQTVISDSTIARPKEPRAIGYIFDGWYKDPGCVQPWDFLNDRVYSDITLYAKWRVSDNPTSDTVLNVGAGKAVDYRAKVKLTVTAEYVPADCKLAVFEGNILLEVGNNLSVTYTSDELTGDKTYTAAVIDENGTVQTDYSGAQLKKDISVSVKTNFFARIIAFFRGLFGSLPTVEIKP